VVLEAGTKPGFRCGSAGVRKPEWRFCDTLLAAVFVPTTRPLLHLGEVLPTFYFSGGWKCWSQCNTSPKCSDSKGITPFQGWDFHAATCHPAPCVLGCDISPLRGSRGGMHRPTRASRDHLTSRRRVECEGRRCRVSRACLGPRPVGLAGYWAAGRPSRAAFPCRLRV